MTARAAQVYGRPAQIARAEFKDIVASTEQIGAKLRINLRDSSHLDVWLSQKRPGTYAYHWERRHVNGSIYRHNNLPGPRARRLHTFPKHYHAGTEGNLPDDRSAAIRDFLGFARRVSAEAGRTRQGSG